MMNVNVCAVTHLSHLYGQNMKRQGRGRILFVSSVIGATPGGPGVATYAATKSYEKSLAQSMGRELEKYGVGVTCIMPGAVRGTDFAVKSNCADSACWKFPCYSMSTPNVAARGVRALLSGDSEIIPGWHNRLFLKVFSPLLPPRLTTSIVGFSFSPFQFGMPTFAWGSKEQQPMNKEEEESYQQQIIDNFNVPPKIIKLADLDTSHDKNTSPPIQMESPSSFTQNMDPSGSRVDNEEEHLTKTADESELGSAI
jgi:Short-chain dehydrogenases of various substrate specificities